MVKKSLTTTINMGLDLVKDLKFTCQRGCQKGCDYCKVVERLFEIRWYCNTLCGWMGGCGI